MIAVCYTDRPHDAETLLVDPTDGGMYIITKDDDGAEIYRIDFDQFGIALPRLRHIASLDVKRVSAGDISRDGSMVLLRREGRGWLWHRDHGSDLAATFSSEPKKVPIRSDWQADNGEAIGFTADGSGYWTVSEGKEETICLFPLPD